MAVAVKTSPGAKSGSSLRSPAILSLLGVVYLLCCLGIIFKLVPTLWWSACAAMGLSEGYVVEAGVFLVLVDLAVAVGLLLLGGRLLGPEAPEGVRGGIFIGFVGLLLVLLLARWASLWIEHAAYEWRYFTPSTGAIILGVLTAALLLGAIRLFMTRRAQNFAVLLESGGWFSATSYKANQGQKVRRGTIVAILVLTCSGIWTLVSHGSLRRGPTDWVLDIPFTGHVVVQNFGDAQGFIAALPDADKSQVKISTRGASAFTRGQVVSAEAYRKAVDELVGKDPELGRQFKAALQQFTGDRANPDISAYLLAVNTVLSNRMAAILSDRTPLRVFDNDGTLRKLNEVYTNTSYTDLGGLVATFEQAAGDVKAQDRLGAAFTLPTGLLLMDQFALQSVNDKASAEKNLRVGYHTYPKNEFAFERGTVVSAAEFGKAEVTLLSSKATPVLQNIKGGPELLKTISESAEDGADFKARVAEAAKERAGELGQALTRLERTLDREALPERVALAGMYGVVEQASIPILPSVRYTLPLLLVVLSLWLAWRVVNMPAFADFLIATEAELNKVSWTSQKRLFQDTVVVLVTVVLMSVFLFGTDWAWKVVLGWEPIGVLHIPKDQKDSNATPENQKW